MAEKFNLNELFVRNPDGSFKRDKENLPILTEDAKKKIASIFKNIKKSLDDEAKKGE